VNISNLHHIWHRFWDIGIRVYWSNYCCWWEAGTYACLTHLFRVTTWTYNHEISRKESTSISVSYGPEPQTVADSNEGSLPVQWSYKLASSLITVLFQQRQKRNSDGSCNLTSNNNNRLLKAVMTQLRTSRRPTYSRTIRGRRHLAKAAPNDFAHTARGVHCTSRRRFKSSDRQKTLRTSVTIVSISCIRCSLTIKLKLNCAQGEHRPARCRFFATVTLRLTPWPWNSKVT